MPIELAVIIPTYNERENVAPLLALLEQALARTEWEAIFVDDNSPDGTSEFIRGLAANNRRVRVLERIGRRGLSSACIEGMLATAAQYIAVMDADLQHDESILPKMLERMKSENLDIVVASRKIEGGSMREFPRARVWLSTLGSRISRWVSHSDVSDPMSGFFLVQRSFFRQIAPKLTGTGFKILVDLLASTPPGVHIGEVAYQFRMRQRGESKLDLAVELEYLYLLIDKMIGGVVPTRFLLFVLVGSLGLLIHLSILGLLFGRGHVGFLTAQTTATVVAMTFNFILNNIVTFRDRQLKGWRILSGLLTFYLACSAGAVVNVIFAQRLMRAGFPWYLAGISGIAVSSVWNYGVNTIFTWRSTRLQVEE